MKVSFGNQMIQKTSNKQQNVAFQSQSENNRRTAATAAALLLGGSVIAGTAEMARADRTPLRVTVQSNGEVTLVHRDLPNGGVQQFNLNRPVPPDEAERLALDYADQIDDNHVQSERDHAHFGIPLINRPQINNRAVTVTGQTR